MSQLRTTVRHLYYGSSRRAIWFQYFLLAFDLSLITVFVVLSFFPPQPWLVPVDIALAAVLTLDLFMRLWSAERRLAQFARPSTWADAIVITSLFLPFLTESYAFLRLLRALRILRSYHVIGLLARRLPGFRRYQDVVFSIVNLVVFMFVMTAVVYVTQHRTNPAIANYVDALYFTVTTLTTTGFGDITLEGSGGRLLSVLIMVFGISLFVRLAQTVFRPGKVRYRCPTCGLLRHDPDAVHCKHCGTVVNIPTEGEG